MAAVTFEEILKFNPYHDAKGRFSTSDAATQFTYAPGKSRAHDLAIQREKERAASMAATPKTDSSGNELSPEQQEYFKDSKVRDGEGNLLVMYHGTANGGEFTEFDGNKLGNEARTSQIGQGFYFTNVKTEAEAYMKNVDIYGRTSRGKDPHMYECYLDIRNPFNVKTDTMDLNKAKAVYSEGDYDWFFSNWIPFDISNRTINGKTYSKSELQAMDKSQKVSLYVDYLYKVGGNKEVLSNMVRAYKSGSQNSLLQSMGKNMGIDGVVEEYKPGKFQYSAFSSSQIKSVSNKTPTRTGDITKSAKSFIDVLKANPWHDPSNGRFTTGPGGAAWSASIQAERDKVMAMRPNEQALYVWNNDGETEDNCIAAMENGQTEALVNNYFAIMEANGDPTPTNPTSDQLNIDLQRDVESGKYPGYTEARIEYMKNMSGLSDTEASATLKEMETWFGGSWTDADTGALDKYVENDHVYDGKIYRGMKFDHADFDSFMENVSPGAEISMKRNSSWSSDEDVARLFGAHIDDHTDMVMLTCVKNKTSAPVAHLSTAGEAEVLAHSKAKWTVLHAETVTWPSGAKKAYITVVEKEG